MSPEEVTLSYQLKNEIDYLTQSIEQTNQLTDVTDFYLKQVSYSSIIMTPNTKGI